MITTLKPYPAYKDSGVPWLGDVLEHWKVRRLCTVVEIRIGRADRHCGEAEGLLAEILGKNG